MTMLNMDFPNLDGWFNGFNYIFLLTNKFEVTNVIYHFFKWLKFNLGIELSVSKELVLRDFLA